MSPAGRGVVLPRAAPVRELASHHGGTPDPSANPRRIERITSPRDARQDTDLVVLTSGRWLNAARDSSGVVLCTPELATRLPEGRRWVHAHVMWAVAGMLGPDPDSARGRSRHAVVEPGAEVADDATIAPGAVVLAGARIGSRCRIGANAVVYGGVTLGKRVVVGPGAVIGRAGFGWCSGPDGQLRRVPQRGGVTIGDDCEIGALATVDAGTLSPTELEAGVKLDAHVHVGHNTSLGAGTLVAAQAGFAGSVELGPGVQVGGQAGIADHARVGAGSRIAAKSGVIGDVPAGVTVAGFPAVPRVRWLRAMAALLGRSKG